MADPKQHDTGQVKEGGITDPVPVHKEEADLDQTTIRNSAS